MMIRMAKNQTSWSKDEVEKLKALWESNATTDEILAEFPNRSLASLQNKANRMRFTRLGYKRS